MVSSFYILTLDYLIKQNSSFEIHKAYDNGLQRFRNKKSESMAKTQFLWYLDKCRMFYLRLFWLISRWTKVDISGLKTSSSISSSSELNEMVTFSRLRSRLKDCPCIRVSVEQDDISRTLRFIFLRRTRHLYKYI